MGGVFRAPKIQQRVVPVVDTEAEAKKRAEKEKQENLENVIYRNSGRKGK